MAVVKATERETRRMNLGNDSSFCFLDSNIRERNSELQLLERIDYFVAQKISLDSDSIGTKKSFSGHERSQSTNPSFLGDCRRTSRYSPRLTRLMSSSSPGWISSWRRISA